LKKAPPNPEPQPKGFLTFTLNAHLPYVVNHGTWPHGMEWLHEAAAETYLPLLRMLGRLERDRIRFRCNLNLSPTLLEQLTHPVFMAEFPNYLSRKVVAAREDEAFFLQFGEHHLAEISRLWQQFFSQALDEFQRVDRNIVQGFRHFNDIGLIDIITTAATHSYMPLLGTDESVRAQIHTAVATHTRHFGKAPRGIWAPECGYRPSGPWHYPAGTLDETATDFQRVGLDRVFAEAGLEFFFVDTHLIEESSRISTADVSPSTAPAAKSDFRNVRQSFYHPYSVGGEQGRSSVTVFARDPRTAVQVWSSDSGYPGDPFYLDFHKKRWPGGHRYWRVTDSRADISQKQIYDSAQAIERVKSHAAHFVQLVCDTLHPGTNDQAPPVLNALFDAELFGHWWFEGPQWLEAIARILHEQDTGIELSGSAQYLDRFPPAGSIAMDEGSWGAGGSSQVWLNPETTWTYTHIYPAELYTREVCTGGAWRSSPQAKRIVQQLCRELLLLESSDWQFLITTGAARDYAEIRFQTHNDQFHEIQSLWQSFESQGSLTPEQDSRLAEIERRDGIFPEIDPSLWATQKTTEGNHSSPDV
jgi:1,4-alpha-glucan branching enzyme